MRRKDRERGLDFSLPLIDRCSHGVIALTTGEDTPYCIPISLVRVGSALYFHCAREGRKVDLLRRCPRVCITFVGEDDPALEANGNYTTYFQSAVVTGTAAEVTEETEKVEALRALCAALPAKRLRVRCPAGAGELPGTVRKVFGVGKRVPATPKELGESYFGLAFD